MALWYSQGSLRCPSARGSVAPEHLRQCDAYTNVQEALRTHFRYTNFRPGQLEAILPAVHGSDVFVKMATGSGKSLCMFLVPLSISDSALGVVISPLNGLMDEQVLRLSNVGVKAIRVGDDNREVYSSVAAGEYRFVFMSPETATTSPWRNFLHEHKGIAVVAVDEAHCISEWGKDFRRSFQSLGGLRALTSAPFMALTASAPSGISAEIHAVLELRNPVEVKLPLDRRNIFTKVTLSAGLGRDLGMIGTSLQGGSAPEQCPKTLIFCKTKAKCVRVYNLLSRNGALRDVINMYHATVTEETKHILYREFSNPTSVLRCLVCTVAFGMGMDIPDIHRVVVYGLPASACHLYQLFGRAGRDGSPALAVLFFTAAEEKKCEDPTLKALCRGRENCQRSVLLKGVGSSEVSSVSKEHCCEGCSSRCPYESIDFSRAPVTRKKRKLAVRKVSDSLKQTLEDRLLHERDSFVERNAAFLMLPKSIVCPINVIKDICNKCKFFSTINDIRNMSCLRSQLHVPFFNVVMDTVCDAPPVKRRRVHN